MPKETSWLWDPLTVAVTKGEMIIGRFPKKFCTACSVLVKQSGVSSLSLDTRVLVCSACQPKIFGGRNFSWKKVSQLGVRLRKSRKFLPRENFLLNSSSHCNKFWKISWLCFHAYIQFISSKFDLWILQPSYIYFRHFKTSSVIVQTSLAMSLMETTLMDGWSFRRWVINSTLTYSNA